MRVLEAAVKKLRIIVLVTSCALLGSTEQGCRNPNAPCSAQNEPCNPALSDEGGFNSRCCGNGACIPNPVFGGRCS